MNVNLNSPSKNVRFKDVVAFIKNEKDEFTPQKGRFTPFHLKAVINQKLGANMMLEEEDKYFKKYRIKGLYPPDEWKFADSLCKKYGCAGFVEKEEVSQNSLKGIFVDNSQLDNHKIPNLSEYVD